MLSFSYVKAKKARKGREFCDSVCVVIVVNEVTLYYPEFLTFVGIHLFLFFGLDDQVEREIF